MKRGIVLILSIALLCACGNGKEEEDRFASAEWDPTGGVSAAEQEDHSAGQPPDPEDPRRQNQAMTLIPGFGEMTDRCVAGVKNYHGDMKWMEANQLENLERYAVEEGAYFLILPRYIHSTVIVERVAFVDGVFVPVEETFRVEDTPDGYGLIINNTMPDGGPNLQVTVISGVEQATFDFTVAGNSGDQSFPVIHNGFFCTEANDPAPPEEGLSAPEETEDIPVAGGNALRLVYQPRSDRTLVTSVLLDFYGESMPLYEGYSASTPVLNGERDRFAFIHDVDFEVIGQVLLCDVTAREARHVSIGDLPGDWSPSGLLWLDDDILLMVYRYGYGTVSLGGDVYYCHSPGYTGQKLFAAQGRVQITGFHLDGADLVLEITEYLDDNYETREAYERPYPLALVYDAIREGRVIPVAGK